jgi:subtilisin family serine protease
LQHEDTIIAYAEPDHLVHTAVEPNDPNFQDGSLWGLNNTGQDEGVAGVAWDVQLMAVKFLSVGGSGSTSDAVDCVIYAVENGASVLSNCWGGGSYNSALQDAIEQVAMADVLFVAAAGNDGQNIDPAPYYPAAYPNQNIIGVASFIE